MAAVAGGFSPKSLFANGEQGVWYDPSDLTTLFQDAAGTTPVTGLEQPVGLMLDKSKGLVLGSERVTNGTFDVNVTGWTAQANVTATWLSTFSGRDGVVRLVTSGNSLFFDQTIVTQAGKSYLVTASVYAPSANTDTNAAMLSALSGVTTLASRYPTAEDVWQNVQMIFRADASTTTIRLGAYDGIGAGTINETAYFDNISVRELPGNHASQSTAASRPVLSARVNLLTYTEQFDNAAWSRAGVLAFGSGSTVNAIAAPDGTTTADLITEDTAAGQHIIYNTTNLSLTANVQHVFSCAAKAGTRTAVAIQVNAATTGASAVFDLSNGTVTQSGASADYTISSTITSLGNGWYRCSLTFSSTNVTLSSCVCISNSTTPTVNSVYRPTYTGDGTSGIYIWGADLRVSNDGVGLPSYQRVGAAVNGTSTSIGTPDYDTTGFPVYLRYDGGDWMQTASINFTATDKMSVFAGVRKIDDAQQRVIAELSASILSNNGTFLLDGPTTTSPNYRFASKGTSLSLAETPLQYPAPTTDILTGLADISADGCVMRVDGMQVNQSTADQGTGNFGNYPLYIGARGGTALFFTGRLYGLIIVGRTVTASELLNTENYMEAKTFGKDMAYIYSDELTTAEGDLITADDGDQIYMSVNYQ